MPLAFERQSKEGALAGLAVPWAADGPRETPLSNAAHEGQRMVESDKRYHHYYKKHMTILGLRDELHSSDTDESETSQNAHTKLFRRRRYPPKPKKTTAMVTEEEVAARRVANPWVQHVPAMTRIGLTIAPDEEEDRRRLVDGAPRGKRVAAFTEANDRESSIQQRGKIPHRVTPLERHQQVLQTPAPATSMPGPWEGREAAPKVRRTIDDFRPPPATTPSGFFTELPPPPASLSHLGGPKGGRPSPLQFCQPPRSKTRGTGPHMKYESKRTIVQRVATLQRQHTDGMARHHRILQSTTPIDPLVEEDQVG